MTRRNRWPRSKASLETFTHPEFSRRLPRQGGNLLRCGKLRDSKKFFVKAHSSARHNFAASGEMLPVIDVLCVLRHLHNGMWHAATKFHRDQEFLKIFSGRKTGCPN